MNHAILFPNFGAEEGSHWRNGLRLGPVRTLAQAWVSLFDPDAKLLLLDATSRTDPPIFPWIDNVEGLVPWLSTDEAVKVADERRIRYAAVRPKIVKKVHDKAFAQEIVKKLGFAPDDFYGLVEVMDPDLLDNADKARAHIESRTRDWPSWTEGAYTLKPRYGTSGRGRVGGRNGKVDEKVVRGFPGLSRRGGAMMEPWVERTEDLSAQLYIDKKGKVELLGTTRIIVSRSGVYGGNEGRIDGKGNVTSGSTFDDELRDTALKIGKEAAAQGFYGACGIDAFVFEGPDGEPVLRPLVELNARWTGGVVVIGLLRRAHQKRPVKGSRRWRYLLETDALTFGPPGR